MAVERVVVLLVSGSCSKITFDINGKNILEG